MAQAVSCYLSTHTIQTECLAYITIQTLLLWKALSFLLCAGKHHWEHEQKHKQTGHKQLLLLLVTWVNASLHMFVIQREKRDKTLLIMASTTLTTRAEAYSIMYRTYSLGCFTQLCFILFRMQSFLQSASHTTVELWHGVCL